MESFVWRLSQAGLHPWRRSLWWLCLTMFNSWLSVASVAYSNCAPNCEVITKWHMWHEIHIVKWFASHDPKGMSSVGPSHVTRWNMLKHVETCWKCQTDPASHRAPQGAFRDVQLNEALPRSSTSQPSFRGDFLRSEPWFTTVPAIVVSLGYYFRLKRHFWHWLSFAEGRSVFNRIHVHSCQETLGSV